MRELAPAILILGTRGIPAAHGGFETFAERLALHLVARGWRVGVYCQREVERIGRRVSTTVWHGIDLITVEVAAKGPAATLAFDALCAHDAASRGGVCLVLGYNGAVFLPYLRLRGAKILTNMDGIEWKRPKWSPAVRAFFWISEWIAAWSSHRLVADHPIIADHLATRRPREAIATIPYGGDPVRSTAEAPIRALALEPGRFLVSIARIEPDNNVLTFVEAFSRRPRDAKLVVLGRLDPDNAYHRAIRAAAGEGVVFPGAIYDAGTVQALRHHARAYLHGHTVGGTNPSLVEALWAGNAVIAHDNPFNRGTAGEGQFYFSDVVGCERAIETVLEDAAALTAARLAARRRSADFAWDDILAAYETEARRLGGYPPSPARAARALSGSVHRDPAGSDPRRPADPVAADPAA